MKGRDGFRCHYDVSLDSMKLHSGWIWDEHYILIKSTYSNFDFLPRILNCLCMHQSIKLHYFLDSITYDIILTKGTNVLFYSCIVFFPFSYSLANLHTYTVMKNYSCIHYLHQKYYLSLKLFISEFTKLYSSYIKFSLFLLYFVK